MSIHKLTAHEILEQIKAQQLSVNDVYQACVDQINKTDTQVNAFVRQIENAPDTLTTAASQATPIPIAIKDNMCIEGIETTCASRILKGFIPPYSATVVEKLKASGAILLGHANMDEFAFGSSTETSCYGPTKNPWNLDCVPGGSSGGSTATVAANQAVWALGSDTGGSIRQPASFCGVVGLKPTYGRVSRYGLLAFASSLDQIGPITKDVRDAALLLNIIAGYDPMDSTSIDTPTPDYTKALNRDVKGLTFGVPKEFFVEGLDPQVKEAVDEAINVLKKQGATFKEISLPHTEYAVATYYIIATAEASSNLARYDGVQYGLRVRPETKRKNGLLDMYEETRDAGFGQEAKRRIMLGTYALSSGYYDAYYLRGLKVRTLIKNDYDQAFKDVDAIITPTAPTTAFKIAEKTNDPISMYLSDIFTISANLSGIPAISIPCGFSKDKMPIGLQIMAKPFDEEMIFRIAHNYEQNTEWHKERASI
ncbi:Asp-tRNA(Asn)/Glu-tRNA(Gln) amidotransferase subunit GatA [Candidatus Omnitrophota bacterium]